MENEKKVTLKKRLTELAGIITALTVIWGGVAWLLRPHVEQYIMDMVKAEIGKEMMLEDNSKAFQLIGHEYREHEVTKILVGSLMDSLAPYKRYLDYAQKTTPEGLAWVNGIPYWFTGRRDEHTEPIKYRTHMEPLPDGRIYWIDPMSRKHYIWQNPQY